MKYWNPVTAVIAAIALAALTFGAVAQNRITEQQEWVEQHDRLVAKMFMDMGNAIQVLNRQALPLRGPAPLPERPHINSSINNSIVVFPSGTYIGGDIVPEPINLMKTIAGPR